MNTDSEENADNAEEELKLPDADFSALDAEEAAGKAESKVKGLKSEVEKFKSESEENRDKYLRALAEFENYKKRVLKERSELLKYQGEKVLGDMLSVLDNLELALQYSDSEAAKLKEGLELIHKSFVDILAKWEVKGESSVGMEFDPLKHAAISKIFVEGHKPGTVVNELKKAYFYKDKLLRAAEVVVSDQMKPEEAPESGEETPKNNDSEKNE